MEKIPKQKFSERNNIILHFWLNVWLNRRQTLTSASIFSLL